MLRDMAVVNAPRSRASQGAPPRRRQADRSAETRRRLLDATIDCLAELGYRGATLAEIVARAGVSSGAQVHHFGSRQQLMVEAAEDLLRQTYRDLGEMLLALPDAKSRLERTVTAAWDRLFSTPQFRAYQALLSASHQDPELAAALGTLLVRMHHYYTPAVDHYFQATERAEIKPRTLFLQLACFLHGLAAQAHLAADPALIRYHLKAYAQLMATQLQARPGVRSKPPRSG
jgi:AcrR family transcriptional regulator